MHGRTVIITRPRAQSQGLAEAVRRAGGKPVVAPAIRIAPPTSWRGLDRALRELKDYGVIVFTSANGVDRFFDRAARVLRGKLRLPRSLFAIGPATALALRRRGASGASLPEEFEGEALARHLLARLGEASRARILVPRAKVARDALPRLLREAGARVDVVEAYRTLPDLRGRRALRRAVSSGGEPVVTFTSSSTVRQFVSAVGAARARRFFRRAAAASIGPITSGTLRAYGIRPAAEARPYTVEGLARAIRGLGA